MPTEDTDVSLRGNDETFHGLPSWIGIRVIPVKHEEIVATAPYGKREPRIVGKQTHRGFQTAKLNRITPSSSSSSVESCLEYDTVDSPIRCR